MCGRNIKVKSRFWSS